MKKFFIRRDEKEDGPFSALEIKRLIDSGQIAGEDLVREENKKAWHRVSSIKQKSLSSSASSLADSSGLPPQSSVNEFRQAQQPSVIAPDVEDTEPFIKSSDDSDVFKGTLIENFFTESFRDNFSNNQQILLADRLTQKKLEGIHSYVILRPAEHILFAIDTTIFGVATEGFVFTTEGIWWSCPNGSSGQLDYGDIDAYSIYTQSYPEAMLVFSGKSSGAISLQLKSAFAYQSLQKILEEFFVGAVQIFHNTHPPTQRVSAKRFASGNDVTAAVEIWNKLLEDNDLVLYQILSDVEGCDEEFGQEPTFRAFHDRLKEVANNRLSGWLLPRNGQRPESITFEALINRWQAGEIRRDSQLQHISDACFGVAGDVPELQQQRLVYVVGTGEYDQSQFFVVRESSNDRWIELRRVVVFRSYKHISKE